jgi:Ni/Co efflux regulator RcnB
MKRLILSALAATMLTAPVAAPAFAAPPSQYGDSRDWNNGRDNDRNWDRDRDRNDRHDNRYDDRRDNRYERYDARQHNGYYIGRSWHFGPPPASVYRLRDYHPGFKPWKRGDRLGYYNNRYEVVDYRARHLRAPPRGYHYVRDDRGDVILAAIATGIIAAVIAGAN